MRSLNINKILSLFFIQIIFLSFIYSKGIIGNPNNKFKDFIGKSEVNEIITNKKIFLIGELDDKLLHLLKFYLPEHKKIDMDDISSKEIIYGFISNKNFIKLNELNKSKSRKIKEYKSINLIKIN